MEGSGCASPNFKDNFGLCNTVCEKTTLSSPDSSPVKKICDSEEIRRRRKVKCQDGISVTNFPNSKIKRKSKTDFRSAPPKQASQPEKIPSYNPVSGSRISSRRGLHGKIRFQSGLFPYSYKAVPPKVPLFRIPRRTFTDDVSPIRFVQRPVSILSGQQLDSECFEERRDSGHSLLGRFSASSSDSRNLRETNYYTIDLLQRLGWCVNLVKSITRVTQEIEFLGIVWDTKANQKRLPTEKIEALEKILKRHQDRGTWSWKTGMSLIGKLGFAAFVTPMGRLNTRHIQRASRKLPEDRPLLMRAMPMPALRDCLWWTRNLKITSSLFTLQPTLFVTTDASDVGWGIQLGDFHLSGLWQDVQVNWHINEKELFTVYMALSKFRDVVPSTAIDNGTVRQHDSSFIHPKSGGYKVGSAFRSNKEIVESSSKFGSDSSRFLPTGSIQLNRRLSVERETSSRLASQRRNNSKDFSEMGNTPDRFVRNSPVKSSSELCVHRFERSPGLLYKCIQSTMELQPSLGVSSATINTQSASAFEQSCGDIPISSASVGEGILEGRPQVQSDGSSLSNIQYRPSFDGYVHQLSSPDGEGTLFRGLEDTGWGDLAVGLDPEDVVLLHSAWRVSTWRTYKSAWKQWVAWCKENNVKPNKPNPQLIASYLGYLSRVKKLAYSTILVHKSVVVTLANPMLGQSLSSHPLITTMLKALSNKSCSTKMITRPRIWNIQDLVQWLRTHIPLHDSIFQISRHVALLLLIASGRRVHDLTLLHIDKDHCEITDTSIIFWPSFGSKSDNAKNRQSGWQLCCSGDPALSLVIWIKCLIKVSADRRKARKNLSNMFISTRSIVKPASRAVIAGWLKAPFADLGINLSPGSIRSAVASYNYQQNVPLDQILQQGNWRGSENFFKHYCRPVDKPRDANAAVLNGSFKSV